MFYIFSEISDFLNLMAHIKADKYFHIIQILSTTNFIIISLNVIYGFFRGANRVKYFMNYMTEINKVCIYIYIYISNCIYYNLLDASLIIIKPKIIILLSEVLF